MSNLSFLDAFPADDGKVLSEAWDKVRSIVSEPHSAEAHANLISVIMGVVPTVFTDDEKFTEDGKRVRFRDLSPKFRKRMVEELLQGIPRDKQLAFGLTEFLGHLYRSTYDAESWSNAPIEMTRDRLIIDGHQVMDAWETPIMHGMVDSCLDLTKGNVRPKVLELGWGMGISGTRFVERGVDYTVVEANAHVAENARKLLAGRGEVVQSLWQEAKFEPDSFDIVFFDVYYTTHDQGRDYLLDVLTFFQPLLKSGGIFTYFIGNHESHIPKLLDAGFSKVICSRITGFEVPADCSYARPDMKAWLNVLAVK